MSTSAPAPAPEFDSEWDLTQAVLAETPGASDRFAITFRDSLIGFLKNKCDPTDGRSREKAGDIVDALIAECCHGDAARKKGPLLEKFGGKGSLEGWLRRSVYCRLISWWRSLEYRSERTESSLGSDDGESVIETRVAGETDIHAEPAVADVLRDALLFAFQKADETEPLGLVFLRLSSLHGVQKQRLARAWDRDPAQAGRRIAKALDIIRTSAEEYVRSVDPWLDLEWKDYLKVFEVYPDILHGNA